MSRHALVISQGDTNLSGPSPEPCSFPFHFCLREEKECRLLVLGCRGNLGVGCRSLWICLPRLLGAWVAP